MNTLVILNAARHSEHSIFFLERSVVILNAARYSERSEGSFISRKDYTLKHCPRKMV